MAELNYAQKIQRENRRAAALRWRTKRKDAINAARRTPPALYKPIGRPPGKPKDKHYSDNTNPLI